METVFDAIVLGLGAMGSATAYQLAKRGAKVLGIDRFSPPHALGSTHGDTRITRQAIGEGEQYTPLSLRSYEIFREVEARTGRSLLTVTGGLIISSATKEKAISHVEGFFDNTVATARRHGVLHEVLDAAQIRARFPPFNVRDDEVGYYEPGAGFLRPEACVAAQLELARQLGARIHCDETVEAFSEAGGVVTVRTNRGEHSARRLVVAAGAWVPELVDPQFARLFRVSRQVQYWFELTGPVARFEPGNFPIFIWELQGQRQPLYGFPAIDGQAGGIKIASEQWDVSTTPDAVDREVSEDEALAMFDTLVAPHLSGVCGTCVKASACLYTSTPDAHFVIDRLPGHPGVIVASPCSGHGFKHSAAIGEALAQLALEGRSAIGIESFSLGRFG
jgi:sarcosine oxidase